LQHQNRWILQYQNQSISHYQNQYIIPLAIGAAAAPHCLGEQNKHFPDDYKVADATKPILKSFWTVNSYIQTRAHGITMCVIKYLHLSQHVSPSKAAAARGAAKAE
jgi:hypothetical protein